MKAMNKLKFNKRPLSWSAISSFEYNPQQWYSKYILHTPPSDSIAMDFGKKFAKSVENRTPLVPVTIYEEVEYPLKTTFNKIPLVGYLDTYKPHTAFREYKTSKNIWTQEKCDNHGQLKMYALMLYLIHKVKPEDLTIHLDCIQTKEFGNFEVAFLDNTIHSFEVKLNMKDILLFGSRIMKTVDEMNNFIKSYPLD